MFLLPHQFVRIMKDIHNKQKCSFLPRCFIDSSPSLFFHIFVVVIHPTFHPRRIADCGTVFLFTTALQTHTANGTHSGARSVRSRWRASGLQRARRRGTAQARPKPPTSSSVHHHLQNHERSRETTVSNKTASCGAVPRC